MNIDIELYEEVFEELLPLAEEHWDEVPFGPWKELGLQLNHEMYFVLEEQGFLRLITARDEGELVGYLALLASEMNHHKGIYQATSDVIYVDPAYRDKGVAKAMLEFAFQDMKANGVEFLNLAVNPNYDFSEFCERSGGVLTEKIYTWRM